MQHNEALLSYLNNVDIIDDIFSPTDYYLELLKQGKIKGSYNDTFEGKLAGLLLLLINLRPHDGKEKNMISITIHKSDSFCPPLFQIIALNNDRYLILQLAEETHEEILKCKLNKNELSKVKNMIGGGKEMVLLYGPHQVVTYNF